MIKSSENIQSEIPEMKISVYPHFPSNMFKIDLVVESVQPFNMKFWPKFIVICISPASTE